MAKSKGTIYISRPRPDDQQEAERLSVIKQLVELGYSVKIPMVSGKHQELGEFTKAAMALGAKPHKIEWDSPLAHTWIRDRLVHLRENQILGMPRDRSQHSGIESPLVIEGKSIRSKGVAIGGDCIEIAKNVFLISEDTFRNHPSTKKHVQEISEKYGVRFVPVKNVDIKHIDVTSINSIPGLKLVITTPRFMELNPHLDGLFSTLKYKVAYTEEGHLGATNFLKLGPRKILITKDAPKTAEIVRSHGGTAIPTLTSLEGNMSGGGGIRCFSQKSNALYRKVHGHRMPK